MDLSTLPLLPFWLLGTGFIGGAINLMMLLSDRDETRRTTPYEQSPQTATAAARTTY